MNTLLLHGEQCAYHLLQTQSLGQHGNGRIPGILKKWVGKVGKGHGMVQVSMEAIFGEVGKGHGMVQVSRVAICASWQGLMWWAWFQGFF
jgi:hypothetical protein